MQHNTHPMIEIKEIPNEQRYPNFQLYIDGKAIPRISGQGSRYWCFRAEDGFDLDVWDISLSAKVARFSPINLRSAGITKLTLKYHLDLELFRGLPTPFGSSHKRNQVRFVWRQGNTAPYCYFWFDFDSQNWAKPYSYQVYKEYLRKELAKLIQRRYFYLSVTINRQNDTLRLTLNPTKSIEEQVHYYSDILNRSNHETWSQLALNHQAASLREFNFPPGVRATCEQYLIYFADFLRDLGVAATTDISHDDAGRTLFNIQPENPAVALDAIREALELYLELPMSPIMEEESSDRRVLSIQAELNGLKAKLNLAQIRHIELEERSRLQQKLIASQEELLETKNDRLTELQNQVNSFGVNVISDSALPVGYLTDGEILGGDTESPLSNKEIDLGVVSVKPVKLIGGVEANTPRLTRLGIKKGKELFDYLDKKFNSSEC